MKIRYLGIELERVQRKDLDCVRKWRNQPEVRQFMRYQRPITYAEQLQWFRRTQREENLYFVLRTSEEGIALLQLSDIDYNLSSAEVGIFLGEEKYRGTYLPWLGSYTLLFFAFKVLKLSKLRATVSSHNKVSLQYNSSLGFRKEEKLDEHFFYYTLSDTALQKAVSPYQKLINRLEERPICLSFLPEERYLEHLISLRTSLREDPEGRAYYSYRQTS